MTNDGAPLWRPSRALSVALCVAWVTLVGGGVAAELLRFSGVASPLLDMFSLSVEANIPTWFSSMLLFSCAVALAAQGRRAARRWRTHWRALGAVFVAISLDEVAGFHERLNALASFGGALYFGWVVPFSVFVLIVAVLCVPFLRALPRPTRRAFVLSAVLYVGGAIGVELVLGWWTATQGPFNLAYRLIDAVEESAEIAGASLFLWALLQRPIADGVDAAPTTLERAAV